MAKEFIAGLEHLDTGDRNWAYTLDALPGMPLLTGKPAEATWWTTRGEALEFAEHFRECIEPESLQPRLLLIVAEVDDGDPAGEPPHPRREPSRGSHDGAPATRPQPDGLAANPPAATPASHSPPALDPDATAPVTSADMTANTLLAHLISRFAADRQEVLVTEALAHLCQHSPAVRQGLASFASGLGAPVDIARVKAQHHDPDSAARPDLVAFDASGQPVVIIEAKFNAGLTDQQPHAYLAHTDGLVLVVCPARRIEPLWGELLRRTAMLGPRRVDHAPGPTRLATIDGHADLAITSWRVLLEAVRHSVTAAEPGFLGDVDQLRSLCGVLESNLFLPLRSEELTDDTGTRILQYNRMVDDLTARLRRRDDVNTYRLRTAASAGWYGQYLNLPRGFAGLLHFSAEKWSETATTPLWLYLKDQWGDTHDPARVEHALAPLWATPNQPHWHDDAWNVPLHLPLGRDRDDVLNDLEAQLHTVLDIIAASQ